MAAISETGRLGFLRRPLARTRTSDGPSMSLRRQLILQALCIFISITVLFPIVWIVSMAIDPRNVSRPDGLNLIPPGASLDAFSKVISRPTNNDISFLGLAKNSFLIAISSSALAVLIGWRQPLVPIQRWLANSSRWRPAVAAKAGDFHATQAWLRPVPSGSAMTG